MMALLMRTCDGAIKPPFGSYEKPVTQIYAKSESTLQRLANLSHNMCDDSKKANHTELIQIYVLYAFRWSTKNVLKLLPTKMINDIISGIEQPVHAVLEVYCGGLHNIIKNDNTHLDLENRFKDYEMKIHESIKLFSSTIKTVCSNLKEI